MADTKILIVDDSAFMRSVLKNILEGAGYSNFVEGENGNDARTKTDSEAPALILLDLIMPETGGMGIIAELSQKAKVIVISAVGQDESVNEAKANGASDYIVKPFENDQVVNTINKVLGL
ncbi:response regulator [Candidatus Gracilibacteria bacterium]|nr:response regulator [Candidatus Gracilibacteria bacterium]